ncbi:MAG TPA: tyrosine-type recombinase/integrase, partial [Candidatus Saccharimonadales bacterium]
QRRVVSPKGVRTVRSVIGAYREFTLDDAREKAGDELKKMRHGTDLIAEKKARIVAAKTLQQVLDEYLEKYSTKLRPKTKDVYRSAVRRCFADWLSLPITIIDEDMVADKHTALSNAHGPRGKGEAQANQAMRILRTLFYFAMLTYKDVKKQPLIVSNPVRGLKARRLWNKSKSRDDIIDDDDLEAWYEAVMKSENETIRDYMLLCLFTGLRRSEAASLKWDNILRLHGKKPVLVIPAEDTKTNSEHQLPLSDFLVCLLDRRSKVRLINNKYVFPGEDPSRGNHIVEPKRVIASVVNSSGINFSMHTLRRTFGTVAGKLDIAHYKHKMLMNHSMNTEVTGSHYVKLTVEDLREPMQKIADHIKEKAGIDLEEFKQLVTNVS